MAVPKKKTSKSRRNMRRSHDKLAPINAQECPNCGGNKLPHRMCPSCGYYAQKKVAVTKDDRFASEEA